MNLILGFLGLGTFVTRDHNLELRRLEHFHMRSNYGAGGGHYHYDTTPEIVEYEGFFVVGERIIRIDKGSAFANLPNITCFLSFLILPMFYNILISIVYD